MKEETRKLCIEVLTLEHDEIMGNILHLQHQLGLPHRLRILEGTADDIEDSLNKLRGLLKPIISALDDLKMKNHEIKSELPTPQ